MTKEELQAAVDGVPYWFHRINLGQGVVTPGFDPVAWKIQLCQLPQDLTGKTVLDIGAWDGALSFEAERRGAAKVVALDSFIWNSKKFAGRQGFDVAHRALNSKVIAVEHDILNVDHERLLEETGCSTFDVVLFLGVLYHMRHPLLSLEKVFELVAEGGTAYVETHIEPGQRKEKRPVAVFFEKDELGKDPTNWWGPNSKCVQAMCRAAGFRHVKPVGVVGQRAAFHAIK